MRIKRTKLFHSLQNKYRFIIAYIEQYPDVSNTVVFAMFITVSENILILPRRTVQLIYKNSLHNIGQHKIARPIVFRNITLFPICWQIFLDLFQFSVVDF
jgi:hypothetical protein